MLLANQFLGSERKSWLRLPLSPERRRDAIHLGSCLVALTALLNAGCEKKTAIAAPSAPDVEVVIVEQRDVPVTREWVATLQGLVNADVRSQVSGNLIKQNYANGAAVGKGASLFQVDPRPYQAALDEAKANVEHAKGMLIQARAALEEARATQQRAEAALGRTEIDVKRYAPLAKEQAISQREMDDAVQANMGSQAQVAATKAAVANALAAIGTNQAAIEAAQAAVETAQLNLGFTKIVSPIDGVAGIANVHVGDLVGPQSPNPLVTVSTVDPILGQFAPSEQEYLSAMRRPGISAAQTDAQADRLSFDLVLANGAVYPHKGRLVAIGRDVDVQTGAINLQAQFPNPGNVLRPGGFGSVRTVVRVQRGAALVPQRAVTNMQGAYLVAVVGSDNKVSIRTVKPGPRTGSMWVIDEGLKPGEQVVAEGVQKVKNGTLVNPKPYVNASGKT
jgi:membrane fusion protein (multidrug efflux system)